jgi:hypothetical protein
MFYNGTVWIDYTFEAGTSGGTPLNNFGKNNQFLYVGRTVAFASTYFNIKTPATGMNMKVEYFNGSGWATLTTTNSFLDGTKNWTITEAAEWDKATMSDWETNVSVEDYTAADGIYWIRFSTTTNATIMPTFNAITPQGINRFEIYQSPLDTVPSFSVAPNGDTVIGGTLLANGFYGEGYNSTNLALTMTTQSVWYNITGFFSGEMSGWNLSNSFIFTCTQAGLYDVYYSFNGAVNNNDIVQYRFLVNNVLESKGDITMRYSNAQSEVVNVRFLRRFAVGDVVYIQVMDTSRNGAINTFDNRNVMMIRIGN